MSKAMPMGPPEPTSVRGEPPRARRSYGFVVPAVVFLAILILAGVFMNVRMGHQDELNKQLMDAVMNTDASSVQSLLQEGADPNTHTSTEETSGYLARLDRLFRRANEGKPALDYAKYMVNDYEAMLWLIRQDVARHVRTPGVPESSPELIANFAARLADSRAVVGMIEAASMKKSGMKW